jgi:acyl-CoA reductase-like NAD-dependent aldehyde dehydrogenase
MAIPSLKSEYRQTTKELSTHPRCNREIFGPILSVIPIDSLEEAIAFIKARYVGPFQLSQTKRL